MKTLKFQKATAQGQINGVFRFLGKYIFIKKNNDENIKQIVGKLKTMGAEVIQREKWLRIDLFKISDVIKLGDFEINTEEPLESIENKLSQFYFNQFTLQGFLVNLE